MKVLVIGASGQLGKRLAERLRARNHEVVGTGFSAVAGDLVRLDLGDVAAVESLIRRTRPDVILNPGGITAVDLCESRPEEAEAANAAGPAAVARAAREVGAHFVHLSTDFVFDGEKGPYREEDEPTPNSVYSRSKLEGERRIRAEGGSWAILRTAVVYSYEEEAKNFLMQIVRAGRAGGTYSGITDQSNSPTQADNLADAVMEFAERRIEGLFHVAGACVVSRYAFARDVMKIFGFPQELIVPVKMNDLNLPAPRPRNAGLVLDKARGILKTKLLNHLDGIQLCLKTAGGRRP